MSNDGSNKAEIVENNPATPVAANDGDDAQAMEKLRQEHKESISQLAEEHQRALDENE